MKRNQSHLIERCRRFWRADFLTPRDLVLRAGVIGVLFLIAHVAGLREYTTFLSGTVPSAETSWRQTSFLGLVYIFLYFGVTLLVPILLLAAGILTGVRFFRSRSKASG